MQANSFCNIDENHQLKTSIAFKPWISANRISNKASNTSLNSVLYVATSAFYVIFDGVSLETKF